MASATIISDFRESFPELDESVTNADIRQASKIADDIVPGTKNQYLFAVAHLTQTKDLDVTGDTTSVNVGGVSRGYKTISKSHSDVFWSTTYYGRTYLTLVRQTPKTGLGLVGVV